MRDLPVPQAHQIIYGALCASHIIDSNTTHRQIFNIVVNHHAGNLCC